MHPVFARPTRLGWYLLAWAPQGAMLAYLLRVPGTLSWREASILAACLTPFYAMACLAPWNVCRQFPLPSTRPAKLALIHFGAALLAAMTSQGVERWVGGLMGVENRRLLPTFGLLVGWGMLLYSLSVALHYMLLAVEASRGAELQARDAELKALKAQINPHFLFNSLNSISALTSMDPARAREMCIRLSDFLRATLGLGEKEAIPWSEELALTRSYLEVEQVRFGERLRVEMEVAESCDGCLVPPLVLQPLVENAVKHGIATLVEGGAIRLEGRAANGILAVAIENPFDPEAPAQRRSGRGLRNVRDRLETRYGGAARLVTRREGGRFRAELWLPCGER